MDFTSNTQSGNAPLTVTFTDGSTPGGTAYAWTFGSGEGTGTGATVSHTYSTPGTYTVTLTVTYPMTGTESVEQDQLHLGQRRAVHRPEPQRRQAQQRPGRVDWLPGSPGTVASGPGAPNGNFTILSQSITAASQVPCSSSVTVNNP